MFPPVQFHVRRFKANQSASHNPWKCKALGVLKADAEKNLAGAVASALGADPKTNTKKPPSASKCRADLEQCLDDFEANPVDFVVTSLGSGSTADPALADSELARALEMLSSDRAAEKGKTLR